MKLPDLLKSNLAVIFCGVAVGNRSAQQESYYSGCGNKFYCVLFHSGFTPIQLIPTQYKDLLSYDIGLTDLVKLKSGMDKGIKPEDYDVAGFKEKILKYSPLFVCFNGKEAAKAYFENQKVDYGLQPYTLETTQFFVAPSTSPTAHGYWDERLWKELNKIVNC